MDPGAIWQATVSHFGLERGWRYNTACALPPLLILELYLNEATFVKQIRYCSSAVQLLLFVTIVDL